MKIIERVFGSYSEKEIKKIIPLVDKIESLEPKMEKLTDDQLRAKTDEFRQRINKGETLEDILVEAYAVVREASKRVLGLRHFRVQLIGGIILHQGRIAEMKTGEGKTLVVTLPAYLNALSNKSVHVITVNDYLARFHSIWMGRLYKFLGLTVGLVVPAMTHEQKRQSYLADITYGTNNEFGFDYLRDNMCHSKEEMVQRDLNYAVVDEVDSILIDEARTPLVISGIGTESTELYTLTNKLVKSLKARYIVEKDDKAFDEKDEEYDYVVDLKSKTTNLTDRGTKACERYFNIESLSDIENMKLLHHVNQALKAYGIMKKDLDYIERDGEILIVDEFTGRVLPGRRYSEGLHQAIEAKENVRIENETKNLASITFQNYFRLYSKLAGMTGTAKSEEIEFKNIFGLDVVEIPTNQPVIRTDENDVIYKTENAKFKAIIEDVKDCYETGQPVLVGTISIENSEKLSKMLKAEKIPHEVLNAKFHEREAEIIAQAGKFKAVTIATNMAGRGTDILLGGNPEFMAKKQLEKNKVEIEKIELASSPMYTDDEEILKLRKEYKIIEDDLKIKLKDEKQKVILVGGLKIIGSERHESRRIDNQLRGRSGRQGDPGKTKFYVSLEDDLMKLFGGEMVMNLSNSLGLPDDTALEMGMLSRAIETAQKRVEDRNYSIRKSVLEYDDVMNKQRDIIYSQRKQILESDDIADKIINMIKHRVDSIVSVYISAKDKLEKEEIESFNAALESYFGKSNLTDGINIKEKEDKIKEEIFTRVSKIYKDRKEDYKNKGILEGYNRVEKYIMLNNVDEKWQSHIDDMSHLKEGIFLRAYGQSKPIDEYKMESFAMFNEMTALIQEDTIKAIFTIKYTEGGDKRVNLLNLLGNKITINSESKADFNIMRESNNSTTSSMDNSQIKKEPIRVEKTVGRNEPCPCGSGRKYKQCCGK